MEGLPPEMVDAAKRVAAKLDKLADGDSVVLGEFSDGGNSASTPADDEAVILRELAETMRGFLRCM